jgi:hypothetical protein
VAQDAVEGHVVVLAVAELRPSHDAFTGEARFFQGTLLGEVGDVGVGVDAVGPSVGKQITGEQELGPSADASAAGFGEQGDPRQVAEIRAAPGPGIRWW